MIEVKDLWKYREQLQSDAPLIHCITNPISINDCANAVLAIGGKPIMAQHPKECSQITANAKALACNLGNFDDVRAEAMQVSARSAQLHQIPIILDLVGVACSELRYHYVISFLTQYTPAVMKGNLSEIKAMTDQVSKAVGIDVAVEDEEDIQTSCLWIKQLAKTYCCTILCTGKQDIITDGDHLYLVNNGHEMMTYCTGTGCMLNVITASYLTIAKPIEACLMACSSFGIAAQLAYEDAQTPGSFHIRLIDWLYDCEKEIYLRMADIEEVTL